MSELGDLLVLLYGARGRWRSVRLTLRDWSHNERTRAVFERRVDAIEGGGRTSRRISFYAPGSTEPHPETSEHETRVWLDGDRSRVESDREPGTTVVVHDGGTWWLTSPHQHLTNAGDPNHHAGRADEVEQMLDPSGLSAAFELELRGSREIAGRAGIAVRAIPRPSDEHRLFWQLMDADELEVVVDEERGVLLRTEARSGGEPYHVSEIVEIAFDEELPAELFRIELPPGQSFERAGGLRPKHLTLDQAVRLASFALYVPARPGPGWRLEHAVHFPAGARSAESVHFSYEHEDGAHRFQLAESTEPHPWLGSDNLTTVERDGLVLKVLDTGEEDFPMPRHVLVERDGTHVNVMSQDLPVDELVEIAAALVAAPDSPPPAVER